MTFIPTLADVITDLCRRAGLDSSEIDVSQITGTDVNGYLITNQTDAKSAIQNLLAAYFIDCVESDFKLKFVPRGTNSAAMTVPEDDLGIKEDKAKLVEQTAQQQDLPREVSIIFIDSGIEYQQNKTQKQRSSRAVKTKQTLTMQLPMVLSPGDARQIAEKALYLAYLEGRPFSLNLWRAAYMQLDPTDVLAFVYQGQTYQIRIATDSIGVNYASKLDGVSEDSNAYSSSAVGGTAEGVPVESGNVEADTILFLFDIPYLEDTDAIADRSTSGFYVGASSSQSSWPGTVLYRSSDNATFDPIGSSAARMIYGYAVGALPDPPNDGWSWDVTSTLTIQMVGGTLASTDDLSVLNGANALIVGNEVIQFAHALDNGDGTFTISRLLRGRRNTDYASKGHAAGEFVVDPNTGLQRAVLPTSVIGLLRYYRGVTVGQDISGVFSRQLTLAANDLKPAAPVHIKGSRDGSNNLTIGWIRRTRYAGDWLNNTGTVPLNEDSEQYSIDIMSGVTVLRTIAWTPGTYDSDGNPTAAYSAANQTTDGLTPGNAVTVNIYQLSGQVGRGQAGKATI